MSINASDCKHAMNAAEVPRDFAVWRASRCQSTLPSDPVCQKLRNGGKSTTVNHQVTSIFLYSSRSLSRRPPTTIHIESSINTSQTSFLLSLTFPRRLLWRILSDSTVAVETPPWGFKVNFQSFKYLVCQRSLTLIGSDHPWRHRRVGISQVSSWNIHTSS